MPRTKLARRPSPFRPMLRPFFPSMGFPALASAAEDFAERADEMFRTAFAGFPEIQAPTWAPAMNVSEGKDEFTITAELPGMTAKDVNVDYSDGMLSIRGDKVAEETKEEDDRKYYMWERRFGSFQRSLPFPGGIAEDKVTAEFKEGVLTVHLPKAEEAKAKRHAVPINEKQ